MKCQFMKKECSTIGRIEYPDTKTIIKGLSGLYEPSPFILS